MPGKSSLNQINSNFDPWQTLAAYAERLNATKSPATDATVFYETMSGALVWSDEMDDRTPVRLIWALRFLVAYRMSLMLSKPRDELRPLWDFSQSLFPNWVGFGLERRAPNPELLDVYRRRDTRWER